MVPTCLKCDLSSNVRAKIVRFGSYYRFSSAKTVQRFRCLGCKSTFSTATFHPCFRQKKRHKNELLRRLLVSGVSQRRSALILCINRKTVVKKFVFLSLEAEFRFRKDNFEMPKAETIEFDDMETFEHSKCKPLSITLAVTSKERRILGIQVSRMPAKGLLAHVARAKYGARRDERRHGRVKLLKKLQDLVVEEAEIKSDSNPHYPVDVAEFFPKAKHRTFLGKRGSLGGQGELKKVRFDPLFSLNHTCAKLRADVNRLFRRTWCTTKCPDRLYAHLMIYADYHNQQLSA